MSFEAFGNSLINNMENKGYTFVSPQEPLDIGLLKQSFGGMIPKVIGVHASFASTDSPDVVFRRSQNWYKNLLGNNGAGVLLFTYREAPASVVDEVLNHGKGWLGHGQVVGGVYDLNSNKYWLPNHMGWGGEMFG